MLKSHAWGIKADTILAACLVGLFAFMIMAGQTWPERTRLFPTMIAVPMLVLALFQLGASLFSPREAKRDRDQAKPPSKETSKEDNDGGIAKAPYSEILTSIAHMLAFLAGLVLLGFLEAIPVFMIVYLRFAAKEPWWRAILQGVVLFAFVYFLFSQTLHVPFEHGILTDWIYRLFASE